MPIRSKLQVILVSLVSFHFVFVTAAFAMNIDPVDKYAWGENIGWINFGSVEGDVDVSATAMDGYAWGENIGWISLTCSNTASCGTVDFGVTISGSAVAGYAWGENIGWISFNCSNTASCGAVDYGVTLNTATGIFSGYAWGENIGWIAFNCATTASCGDVDYKLSTLFVQAALTPTPTTGGGGGFIPSPSVSPTGVVSPSPSASVLPPGETPPPVTPSVPGGPTESPTPTASPQVTPPTEGPGVSGKLRNWIDRLGSALDRFISYIFERVCRGPLGLTACAVTIPPLMTVLFAVITGLMVGFHVAAHTRKFMSTGWNRALILFFAIGVIAVPLNYLRGPTFFNLFIGFVFLIVNMLCLLLTRSQESDSPRNDIH